MKNVNKTILSEIQEKAKKNERYYRKNDGTTRCVISNSNINYFDENEQKWKHLDNTITETETHYETTVGSFKARLSKDAEKSSVEVFDENTSIFWTYLGLDEPKARKSAPTVKISNSNSNSHIFENEARYTNINEGVDIQYIINNNGIKENIIATKKQKDYSFKFEYTLKGVELKTSENGDKLEFYSQSHNKTEFTISAPYMYDKNNVCSTDVRYEVERISYDTYTVKVIASKDWINSNDRVFPVTIDPSLTLETESIISCKTKVYKLTTIDGYTFEDLFSTLQGEPLKLINTYIWKHYGHIKIDTSCIQEKNNLLQATLRANTNIPISGIDFDCKVIIDNYYYETFSITTLEEFALDIPISKYLKKAENELEIQLSFKNLYGDEALIGYFSLEMEYIEETSKNHLMQTAELVGGAQEIVDLFTGDSVTKIVDAIDENIGIEISHILKRSEDDFCCGEDARLNIHEKLVKNNDSDIASEYIYTDEFGNKHYLKETLYYIDSDGIKRDIIDKASITVLPNGKLEYTPSTTSQTFEVYREEASFCGLKATTKLEGVKSIDWFEQKNEELKNLEQRVYSCEKTMSDYVLIDAENESVIEANNLEAFIENMKLNETKCFSKAEKMNLDTLNTQLSIIDKQTIINGSLVTEHENQLDNFLKEIENVEEQIENIKNSSISNFDYILDLQNSSANNKEYYKKLIEEYVVYNDDGLNLPFIILESGNQLVIGITYKGRIYYFKELGTYATAQYADQCIGHFKSAISEAGDYVLSKNDITSYKILKNQKDNLIVSKNILEIQNSTITENNQNETLSDQQNNVNIQKSYLDTRNDINKHTLKELYKEYVSKRLQLTKLRIHTPVNYMISTDEIRGFNETGDLIVVYDKHGKYVAFEYEEYYSDTNKLTRISRIFNEKEQFMQFVYDHNNLLVKIVDSTGRTTAFEYSSTSPFMLSKIVYPNEEYITLVEWTAYRKTLSTKHEKSVVASSFLNGVSSITNSSFIDTVSYDGVVVGEEKEVSKITFTYDSKKTSVFDNKQNGAVYSFDDCLNIVEAINIEKGLVTSANKYSYNDKGFCVVEEYPKNSCLYVNLNDFIFVMDYDISYEYDEYDNLKSKIIRSKPISSTLSETTLIEYFYDKSNHLIKAKAAQYEVIEDALTGVEKTKESLYEYNSNGLLIKKQSYTKNEEFTNGINIEEYVYNDNGYLTATITYNSLDPSSKYYSEQELNENGQVVSEFDACGMNKTSYYGNTVVYPNGSKFSCGYDSKNGNSSITQNTNDGEENSIQRLYTNGLLTRIISGDIVYDYIYNYKNKTKEMKINGETHSTYYYNEYESNGKPGLETAISYANYSGVETAQTPDMSYSTIYGIDHYMLENVSYDKGKPVVVEKTKNDTVYKTTYTYDEQGNLTNAHRIKSPNLSTKYDEIYQYNENGKLSFKLIKIGSTVFNGYQYVYSDDSKQKLMRIGFYENLNGALICPFYIDLTTDTLGRNIGKSIISNNSKILSEHISYLKYGDHATILPQAISYGSKQKINYKYDNMGNICEIRENDKLVSRYTYDALNRLVREDNKMLNQTVVITYDNNGNILSRVKYPFTLNDSRYLDEIEDSNIQRAEYTYENGRLASYNGSTLEYDAIGNPTLYKGKTLTWSFGKRLASYGTNIFEYDFDGSRLRKNNTNYIYDNDGKLIRQENISDSNDFINFIYDESGVIGFLHNYVHYFYKKDILGNVIELLDTSGNTMVKYTYDAWGNHTVTDYTEFGLGNINPIRYRGYYYDTETGLYYLKSRYYDPQTGRFISMDDISYLDPETINGINLYAYCLNNPISYADPYGNLPFFILTAIIGAVIGVGITAAVDYIPDQEFDLHWSWYVFGGAIGALVGTGIGMITSYYTTGSVASSVGNVCDILFGKTFYRTMSSDDFAYLQKTNKIKWAGGRSETFITPKAKYAKYNYNGVTVRFKVKRSTVNSLEQIGVRNHSWLTAKKYSKMPIVKKGWMKTNAFFKAERDIINIGLGNGQALSIFNSGILWFKPI